MIDRVLVTGGAGFIGSHVVDYLLARGRDVTVLDNFATGSRQNLHDANKTGRLRIVEGSILESSAVQASLEGCSEVFHMAVECVRRSIGKPLANHHINATGTLNVLEAARAAGIQRFTYCSSSEVYGNSSSELLDEARTVPRPVTVYGGAKLAGEHYTLAYHQTYGMDTRVVRPFNAYGPREHCQGDLAEVIPRFLIRILNGKAPIIFGTGENSRDFTYVTEVAEGIVRVGAHDNLAGETVNIAYGQNVSVKRIAELLVMLCQAPGVRPQLDSPRPGDVLHLHASVEKAKRVLGFTAATSIEAGLERYIAWFKSENPDPSLLLEEKVHNWTQPPSPSDDLRS